MHSITVTIKVESREEAQEIQMLLDAALEEMFQDGDLTEEIYSTIEEED